MANRVLIAFDANDPGDMVKDGYSIGQWIQENIK
jgi:hypothetical protein